MRAMRGSEFCFRHDPLRKEEIQQRWRQAVKHGSQRPKKVLTTSTMLKIMMEQYGKLKAWKSKTLLQECEKISTLIQVQKAIEELSIQLELEKASKKSTP